MMMASRSLRGGGGIEGHGSKRTTQDTEGSSDLRAVESRQHRITVTCEQDVRAHAHAHIQ